MVLQCNNCWKEESETTKLKVCAACRRGRWCSKECQVAAWPTHKAPCKLNQAVREAVKQDSELIRSQASLLSGGEDVQVPHELDPRKVAQDLKKWSQLSLVQGLRLNRAIENADKLALLVRLAYRPHKEEGMRFIISEISIANLADIAEVAGSLGPLLQEQASIKAQGKCVMTIAVLRYDVAYAQVVPVLVELGPELDRLMVDPKWAIRLQESVIAGRLMM